MEVSINTRRSQNLKDGHLTNAKNQILIISENCMGRHLPKAKRVTLGMSKKWTKMHRIERDPWCLGWTHVTITCLSQLAKDQIVQWLMRNFNLNVKILHKRCKQWQKSFKVFTITLSVVLNMYVLIVINYGIGPLSESVRQTNTLNVPNLCSKHVKLLLLV